jgi:hypothetical protein
MRWRPELLQLEDRLTPSTIGNPLARPVDVVVAGGFSNPTNQGLTPDQVRGAYGLPALAFNGVVGDGAGQTIAIVDGYDDPNVASDLASFDSYYGTTSNELNARAVSSFFSKVGQNGGAPPTATDSTGGWESEEALDVEWAHVIAPEANIILVEANDGSLANLLPADAWAATSSGAKVISNSWTYYNSQTGATEFSGETSDDHYFTTTGVTFAFASGDLGQVAWPSASPDVVSVGATNLGVNADDTYNAETLWNDTSGSSGRGKSAYESRPAFQNGVSGVVGSQRGTPDVSMVGGDKNSFFNANVGGLSIYDSYNGKGQNWYNVLGTSAATPQWAGLIAIANQGRASAGLGALDGVTQTLPTLYGLSPADFHGVSSTQYNLQTGLGTPVANLLVRDLAGLTVDYTTPPNGTHTVDVKVVGTNYIVTDNNAQVLSKPVSQTAAIFLTAGAGSASTFDIDSSVTVPVRLYLFGTSGNDTFSAGASTVTLAGGASLSWQGSIKGVGVCGLGGADTLNVAAGLTAAVTFDDTTGTSSIQMSGTTGNDTWNTSPNVIARAGDVNISWQGGTTTVTVSGQGGSDVLGIAAGMTAPITFNDTNGSGQLNMFGTSGNDTWNTATNIIERAGDPNVSWQGGTTTITVYGEGGSDVLGIVPGMTAPITFNDGTGSGQINMFGTSGNDTWNTATNIIDRVGDPNVSWQSGTTTITVYGEGGSDVLGIVPGMTAPITFNDGTGSGHINMFGTSGNDTWNTATNIIDRVGDPNVSWQSGTTTVTVYGEGGSDVLGIAAGMTAAITFNDTNGSGQINMQGAAGNDTYTTGTNANSITRTGDATVSWVGGTTNVTVYGNGGSDTLNVEAGLTYSLTFNITGGTGTINLYGSGPFSTGSDYVKDGNFYVYWAGGTPTINEY